MLLKAVHFLERKTTTLKAESKPTVTSPEKFSCRFEKGSCLRSDAAAFCSSSIRPSLRPGRTYPGAQRVCTGVEPGLSRGFVSLESDEPNVDLRIKPTKLRLVHVLTPCLNVETEQNVLKPCAPRVWGKRAEGKAFVRCSESTMLCS